MHDCKIIYIVFFFLLSFVSLLAKSYIEMDLKSQVYINWGKQTFLVNPKNV